MNTPNLIRKLNPVASGSVLGALLIAVALSLVAAPGSALASAVTVEAAYTTDLTIDGDPTDWAKLPSGVITMDTKGRGAGYGTLAVDIQYAWNYTNLYILVKENPNYAVALASAEATGATNYQDHPWAVDSIAFWMDLDNNAGSTNNGSVAVENNADFQPWFGFSSSGLTNLVYARQNDSGTMNLGGVANVHIATSGSFSAHNRTIEIALKWADIAASVDPGRQPGGDLLSAIMPGFVFGSEPLLVCKDYNAQAFVGPDQWNPPSGEDANSRDIRLISAAKVVNAPYATAISIDGNADDWATLQSDVVSMNTQGRGTNGTLAVDIRYAWDYTNFYVRVKENTNQFVATKAQEATDALDYQTQPWLRDTIAFWMDLDNNCGQPTGGGGYVVENNADFQPWFGFSSSGRTDLTYARQNDSGSANLGGLANAQVATSGTFAHHNRTIEIAMKWADIAASVDPTRQPGGALTNAIQPGYILGCEPLLICVDYNAQAFLGPNQWSPGNGVDIYSRDIRLVSGARQVAAAYGSKMTIDGQASDWAALPSTVVSMNTQGRGTNGTLAVDIRYAWNYTNFYVLVKENTNQFVATKAQEATDASDYQTQPWLRDTIAFWMDLDNNNGMTNSNGGIIFENNADFQPWFGFSSAGRTDLIYARQNDSGSANLGGLANAQVATAGTFAQHNRSIEIAMKWADIAGSVDPARQPGGDLASAIQPGFRFGCEPLLISVDYNAQAFIGPNQWAPGNGVDANSCDIQLLGGVQPQLGLTYTNWGGNQKQMLFYWAGNFSGTMLESSPSLNPAAWTQTGAPFLDSDGWNKVLLPPAQRQSGFYRLRKAQ